jgi:WD40 repeat protein
VRGCSFSPDTGRLACASEDRSVVVYSIDSGQVEARRELDGPGGWVAFAPQGDQIAYSTDERHVSVGLAHNPAVAVRLEGHEEELTAFAFNPDGRLLATGSKDKTARVWDVATGREVARLAEHGRRVSCLGFRPDGRTLVTGSWDGILRLWDITAGTANPIDVPRREFSCLAVTPDDRFLLAGDLDGTVTVWNLRAGRAHFFNEHKPHAVTGLALRADAGEVTVVSSDADGVICLWDPATGLLKKRAWIGVDGINALAVSRDGKWLACGCQDSAARVWEIADLLNGRYVFGR